jgi:hypothetical protein
VVVLVSVDTTDTRTRLSLRAVDVKRQREWWSDGAEGRREELLAMVETLGLSVVEALGREPSAAERDALASARPTPEAARRLAEHDRALESARRGTPLVTGLAVGRFGPERSEDDARLSADVTAALDRAVRARARVKVLDPAGRPDAVVVGTYRQADDDYVHVTARLVSGHSGVLMSGAERRAPREELEELGRRLSSELLGAAGLERPGLAAAPAADLVRPQKPLWRRAWFWAAVGGVVLGGTATGVVLAR